MIEIGAFNKPTVYSKPDCVQCTMTKTWLTSRGIPFDEGDILDPVNMDAAKSLGLMSAPIVEFDGAVWGGFDPERLAMVEAVFVAAG